MNWPKEVIDLFKRETGAYDQLDPEIRWLVANMPTPLFSTPDILESQQAFGVKETVRCIKQAVSRDFPRFKWPAK